VELTSHYQNAYVTHDLDKAVTLFERKFGLRDFLVFDPAEMTVRTPTGEQPYAARVATAWAGGLQLELIEPLSGYVDFYRGILPDDRSDYVPRFHHIALRRPTEDVMRREMAEAGFPLVMDGAVPGLTFAYVDARAEFGHYIELCTAIDAMWDYNRWPAQKPVF